MSYSGPLIAIAALVFAGCSAKLAVDHSATGNGLVLRQPAPHAVTLETTKLDKDKKPCGKSIETRFPILPVGDVYTVNVDNSWSWFAKNEFAVEFFESGTPKKVTLNSDPQVDEALKATASLIKEVSSLATQVATSSTGAMALVTDFDAATCGKHEDERIKCVQTYAEWKASPNQCR